MYEIRITILGTEQPVEGSWSLSQAQMIAEKMRLCCPCWAVSIHHIPDGE